jgi:hypothetical protein
MPNAHRFALSALLVLGSAVLAGLVVAVSTPRYAGAHVPPAAALPWPRDAAAEDRRLPFALLYVSSRCEHCSRAAVLIDSAVAAGRLRGFVVTNDARAVAAAYRQQLHLHRPIVLDPASALLHALDTHAVPTLVLFHSDGKRQVMVGFMRDATYRRALDGLER